jgi:hypothetical protein
MDNSWRASLAHDSRQKIVKRIMDTLQRHMPVAGQDGVDELLKIAWRFEEKIFQAATDQLLWRFEILLKRWVTEFCRGARLSSSSSINSSSSNVNSTNYLHSLSRLMELVSFQPQPRACPQLLACPQTP